MQRREFLRGAACLAASLMSTGCEDGQEDFVFATDPRPQPPPTPNAFGQLIPGGAIEALDDGRVVDLQPNRVSVFNADGTLSFSVDDAVLPTAAAIDQQGSIFVLDRGIGRILVLGSHGAVERMFEQDLSAAIDLAIIGSEVFLLNPVDLKIDVFGTEGVFVRTFAVGPEKANLRALAADPEGNLQVLISNPVRVEVISPQGLPLFSYSPPTGVALSARGLAVSQNGQSAILDHLGLQVLLFDANHEFVRAVTVPDDGGEPSQPVTIGLGPDGLLHASFTEVVA